MSNYESKVLCAKGNGVLDRTNIHPGSKDPEHFFNAREMDAIIELMVKRGRRYGKFKKTMPPYGSDSYILRQALVMASNSIRMPSECIMLFDSAQLEFFWGFVRKIRFLGSDMKLSIAVHLHIAKVLRERFPKGGKS